MRSQIVSALSRSYHTELFSQAAVTEELSPSQSILLLHKALKDKFKEI